MNIAKGSFKFTKSIVFAGRLIIVSALMVAALPKVPSNAANARAELPMKLMDAMAAQISDPKLTQIAAGGYHTCALTPQGGVVCWGANWLGELGDGTTTNSAVPVRVNELQSGVMGISLGESRTCALTTQGRVYCWGNYAVGASSSPTPVEVNGLGSQVVQLAVGGQHACALTSVGSVLCWGFNTYGQLGNGTYTDSFTPVTAIASGAIQVVSNSNYSSCAVMSTGGVKCWGLGDRGQLGDGIDNLNHTSAVPVSVLQTGGSPLMSVSHVVLGIVFGCAQVNEGVYCWGRNRFGQLGIGTKDMNTHPYASPVLTALGGPSISGVDQLVTGDEHACVHLTNGNLQCWGHNIFGQLGTGGSISYPAESESSVPVTVLNSAGDAPLTGVTQMTGGSQHTCVFTSWEEASPFLCWGYNYRGELGNGSTYDGTALPTPVSDISNFSSGLGGEGATIVAGGEHTCSINGGGGVSCWGNNAYGQLGNGSTIDSLDPVDVVGLGSEAKYLALGQDHTCAILTSGGLMCWGRNQHGQLGNGSSYDSLVPTYVALSDVSVTQVAVGDDHTCALTEAGGVLCWGANDYGQLGDGTTDENPSPVTIITSGVSEIALGGSTSCAVLDAGGVKCWGLGDAGQLGDGNSGAGYYQSTPTDTLTAASTLLSVVSQISLGANFACALKDDNVFCWGKNSSGQLGKGATSPFEVFASPVLSEESGSPLEGVNQITAGEAHACAHQYTDRVKCWGDNTKWQLGDGSSNLYSAVPHLVLDPEQSSQAALRPKLPSELIIYLERTTQVSADGKYTCAFFGWDSLNPYRCWGANSHGQLGDGTTQDRPYPRMIKDFLSFSNPAVHDVVAGTGFTCGLTAAGGVKCWGNNHVGQLGDGTNQDRLTPVQVSGLESGVISLVAGSSHTCALTSAGGVKCWGDNRVGQLGDGTNTDRPTPVDVSGLTSGVAAITANGGLHTCALISAGGVKCWGWNNYGQLGDGTTTDSNTPVNVHGLTGRLARLEAGGTHTCALASAGGVKCWGWNNSGQLGNGTTTNSSVPVDVTGLAEGITALAGGERHTCALTSSGGVRCWGENTLGELGDGTNTNRLTPVAVNGLETGVMEVDAGLLYTCAVTSTGGARCWGDNSFGQLGDGSQIDRNIPVDVIGLTGGVTSIVTGAFHTCAILSDSSPLRCWGRNSSGQFGDGTQTGSSTPVISNWFTSAGLVRNQKTENLAMTETESAIVVPAQAVPVNTVVIVTIVTPPAPPAGRALVDNDAFTYSEEMSGHLNPFLFYNIPPLLGRGALFSNMSDYDESSINLYFYDNGEWTPVLPCTGCLLDITNHRLIANLNNEGIYAVMVETFTHFFLPLIRK
jgi:alpha-tubulin suppressor-like RCC1 family protein